MSSVSAIIVIVLLFVSNDASADSPGPQSLYTRYRDFRSEVDAIVKTVPLRIRTTEQKNLVELEVFGVIDHPFVRVTQVVTSPASLCDFLLLNLNVKTCTHEERGKLSYLRIYMAGKSYAPPYRTVTIEPVLRVLHESKHYLSVLLVAQKRVVNSTDYRAVIEAAPFGSKTLLRITSRYSPGRIIKVATKAYLKTYARNKVGFSVTGIGEDGRPKYLTGLPAVIERNALRSYLALQAYLETAGLHPDRRFEGRIRRWYELTAVYAAQLHELDRDQYLQNKRREYQNQLRLQRRIWRRLSRAANKKAGEKKIESESKYR